MHTSPLRQLASIGETPLGASLDAQELARGLANWGERGSELAALLAIKNGFFAFESALHVFPSGTAHSISLEAWNTPTLWKQSYGDLLGECLCFAQDLFGNPFCVHDGRICFLEAETGHLEFRADTLEAWAALMLEDCAFQTGYPLAKAWREKYGDLALGRRLRPFLPFVGGITYVLENLRDIDQVEAMRFCGHFAQTIRDLPDGTQFRVEVVDE